MYEEKMEIKVQNNEKQKLIRLQKMKPKILKYLIPKDGTDSMNFYGSFFLFIYFVRFSFKLIEESMRVSKLKSSI